MARGARPRGAMPLDRRPLRAQLQARQARFQAVVRVSVRSVAGEPLAEVAMRGGETVRCLLLRAAADGGADRWQALVEGRAAPCDADLPLPLAGVEDGAAVLLVRVQQLWAATGSLDGTVRLSRAPLPGAASPHGGLGPALVEERVLRAPPGDGSEECGVTAVAFSPCGGQLLAAGNDGSARLWCVTSGELLLRLAGHAGSLTAVAFSPCGGHAATGSKDRTARLWELRGAGAAEGEAVCERVLEGHEASVWSTAFSPDGAMVLTASRDGTARLWEAGTGRSCASSWATRPRCGTPPFLRTAG